MECSRRKVPYTQLYQWGQENGIPMDYTLLTAYLREDRPVSKAGTRKVVRMFNGVMAQRGQAPVFREPVIESYEEPRSS